jgi:hypothetical protein
MPRIDYDESIPPAYVAWRAGTTNGVVVPARQVGNRFLGYLKRFTDTGNGLCIAVLPTFCPCFFFGETSIFDSF